MFRVYAAKQVGDVSYFVGDRRTFRRVIETESIKQSNKQEYNPRTGKKEYYISLGRNLKAAAQRNNTRWRYGIILDGNKLSNRYHIEPFSFMGSALNQGAKISIKELVSYDNGTYKLRLVNWPAMSISENTFNFIEDLILNKDDEFNRSHKLVIQEGGKRRVQGRMINKKYMYNVKHGDGSQLLSKVDKLPGEIQTFLTKDPSTNEFEERLWTSSEYTDISGCIKGIILPKDEIPDFETSTDPQIVLIRDALDDLYDQYDIVYY